MPIAARLSIPLRLAERAPDGRAVGLLPASAGAIPVRVTLTSNELHFAFADRDGTRFAVSVSEIAEQASHEIAALLGIPRGLR